MSAAGLVEGREAAQALASGLTELAGGWRSRILDVPLDDLSATAAAAVATVALSLAALVRWATTWKAKDGALPIGGQTPERLKVFASWARGQVEESNTESHQQMLDDVIYTFASYAQRLERETAHDVRRASVARLLVLAELLETPSVNAALRRVNWAWLREWEQGAVDEREARLRCTMILPTICAAERVQRLERRRSWRRSPPATMGPNSLAYLAAWSTDFLERSDVRQLLGLAEVEEGQQSGSSHTRRSSQAGRERPNLSFMGESALCSAESDSEEDDMSPMRGGSPEALGFSIAGRETMVPEVDAQGGQGKPQDFVRRTPEDQEHVWDDTDSTQSMVRGANYLHDHKKIPSKKSMLELVEVDLVKTYDEITHYAISNRGKVPGLRASGDDRFYFVMNFRLVPIQLCVVWAVPKDADWVNDPEGVLFRRFLEMTTEQRSTRLKVLPKVLEGPWLVKQGVPDRPGVVGKKLACEYFMRQDHLEFSVNCISSPAGRRIVQLLTGASRHFSIQLSIILEGQVEDELPERVLGGLSVFRGDLGKLVTR